MSGDDVFNVKCRLKSAQIDTCNSKTHDSNLLKLIHSNIYTPSFYCTKFGAICMPILHFIETCMIQDTTENSRAPPMRHHGFKTARRVCDTDEVCNRFILS